MTRLRRLLARLRGALPSRRRDDEFDEEFEEDDFVEEEDQDFKELGNDDDDR